MSLSESGFTGYVYRTEDVMELVGADKQFIYECSRQKLVRPLKSSRVEEAGECNVYSLDDVNRIALAYTLIKKYGVPFYSVRIFVSVMELVHRYMRDVELYVRRYLADLGVSVDRLPKFDPPARPDLLDWVLKEKFLEDDGKEGKKGGKEEGEGEGKGEGKREVEVEVEGGGEEGMGGEKGGGE